MNSQPLVSILTPCYNHKSFLADCVESIFRQTYPHIEWIVCDDASADGSFQALKNEIDRCRKTYPEKDFRIELLQNKTNLGITKTLNLMLPLAKGAYIKTFASDDILFDNYAAEAVRAMESHPDYMVCVSNLQKISENEHLPITSKGEKGYASAPKNWDTPDAFMEEYKWNTILAPGAMVRKKAYDVYGTYDETIIIEDLEFWLRLFRGGEKFLFIDKPLVYYRISSQSFMSVTKNRSLDARRVRYFRAILAIVDKYGPDVPEQVYLQKRWDVITDAQYISYKSRLPELRRATGRALYDRSFFRRYPFKKRIRNRLFCTYWHLKYDLLNGHLPGKPGVSRGE